MLSTWAKHKIEYTVWSHLSEVQKLAKLIYTAYKAGILVTLGMSGTRKGYKRRVLCGPAHVLVLNLDAALHRYVQLLVIELDTTACALFLCIYALMIHSSEK